MNTPTRTATLIFNPMAGFWEWRTVLDKVVDFWAARGWSIEIESTTKPGEATDLARAAAAAGRPLVFAAGGDGTLNEVANGLVHSETVMAPLPVGTGNSFTKELGLARPSVLNPAYLLDVCAALDEGQVHAMDVGRASPVLHDECHEVPPSQCRARHWLLWAGTGLDGFVVKQIEPRARWFKRLGPAGYFARALFFLPQFNGVHGTVAVDGSPVEGDFLLINASNCRMWLGGELRLNRRAVLDDGMLEVWLFRGRKWPRALAYGLEISREDHVRNRDVHVIPARSVTITTDPIMPYHLDGEPAGDTPFTLTVCPRSLRLLVPNTAPTDLFSYGGAPL